MFSTWIFALLWMVMTVQVQNMSIDPSMELSDSNIFELPTKVDDNDILEVYGQFMQSTMNMSVSPCEDFYEFACGNWKNSMHISTKTRNDTFLHGINIAVNELITIFLNNGSNHEEPQNTAEAKTKLFYSSCKSMSADLNKGYQDFLKMPEFQINNNITTDWISINFMSTVEMYNLLPLTTHYNTDNRKIELMLRPPHKVLGNPDFVKIQNLTEDLKIVDEAEKKQFMEEFRNMVNFESNLTTRVVTRAANETERLTLGDFLSHHKNDKLNWTRFFNVAFNGTEQKDWVIHNTLQDTKVLVHFLNKSNLDTLRSYVRWRTLIKFYYIWKPIANTNKTVEVHCREQTEAYFSYALVPWLIETIYDADRRADILQIAGNIKESLYNFMDKLKWLDDETQSMAKTKLKAMDVQAGYTDEISHRETMNSVFEEVPINDNWFANVLALEVSRAKVRRKTVNQALIPPPMMIRSANAYYANFLNEAYVAIGISQFPFYHKRFPAALKYGGIGHIIGHEIAHAFDSQSSQMNYDGKPLNWWSKASLLNFRERYRCLEAQYNKFVYQGVATNGSLTLNDNIADNVGTRLSYHAYWQNFGQREAKTRPIPGLTYNSQQLFFLRFAQTWCSGQDTNYKLQRMKTDEHAYEKFRVIGTLRNMPEFSEAFQCKLGASMNPLKKCVIY